MSHGIEDMRSRRAFLKQAGLASVGFIGMQRLMERRALASAGAAGHSMFALGFGDLVKDSAGLLDLPAGFSYRVISKAGDEMADGLLVPGLADGMWAFETDDPDLTVLVRNHECRTGEQPERYSGFGADGSRVSRIDVSKMYDPGRPGNPVVGGTTNVVYNTRTGAVEREWMSLAGTVRNCAGGPTPWGTWLTCEEDVTRKNSTHLRDHGWVFEVPATTEVGLAKAEPIIGMGRFNHEAVAVDPRTGIVYLTEDRGDSLVYRFIPKTPGKMLDGGTLEALVVKGRPSLDTRNWMERTSGPGQTYEVEWIPMDDVEAAEDDLRHRGFAAGAARFARGEGISYADGDIYIVCTTGGAARKGQVWKYTPASDEGLDQKAPGRLTLFVQPDDGDVLDMPDNSTPTPWGGLMLAEDGGGVNNLVGVTPEGRVYKFASNEISEFAGVCFSPDGSTLFVNIQKQGLTVAVKGPWDAVRG